MFFAGSAWITAIRLLLLGQLIGMVQLRWKDHPRYVNLCLATKDLADGWLIGH
jgi:hypothetical protein